MDGCERVEEDLVHRDVVKGEEVRSGGALLKEKKCITGAPSSSSAVCSSFFSFTQVSSHLCLLTAYQSGGCNPPLSPGLIKK